MTRARSLFALALGCLAACTQPATSESARRIPLSACQLAAPGKAPRVAARCGTLDVFEDRAARAGRTLRLRVAVVEATGAKRSKEPLFLLAGGPGQSITELFPELAAAFGRAGLDRDLVLVDQRGTGGSGLLRCPRSERLVSGPDDAKRTALECLPTLRADLRHYGTADAMDDLDDVREALGYERIDLWGVSYGTRAALTYLRQHPDRVRAVVLDGVAPPDWAIPLDAARNAQRGLDRTLARCSEDEACRAAFPAVADDLRALLARCDAHPEVVRAAHPVTGVLTEVKVDRASLGMMLRVLSYSSEGAAVVPLLVHEAQRTGDLRLIAAHALLAREVIDIADGMYLSVVCAEDEPFVPVDEAKARAAGTYTGDEAFASIRAACSVWPRGTLRPDQRTPVTSSVPVLLLSGELDPVTPPSVAEQAARTLSRSKSIVLEGEAHGVTTRGCMPRVIADFLRRGGPEGLDTSCLAQHRPLPFFTSFKGPPP